MHIQECVLVRAKIEDVPDNRVYCMVRNQALYLLQYRTRFLKAEVPCKLKLEHMKPSRELSQRGCIQRCC